MASLPIACPEVTVCPEPAPEVVCVLAVPLAVAGAAVAPLAVPWMA